MRLTVRVVRSAAALGIALALSCAIPAAALGWANGPQYGEGFGTHDWILYHANRSAVNAGYDWVDWPTAQSATDDPDMVLRDYYHHVYDITGDAYGDAPDRIQELYDQAVAELRRGDRIAASRTLGLLSHYLSDVANPLHTDQTPAEKTMHSRYEDAVDNQLESPADGASIPLPHTAEPTADVRELAVGLAASSHADYDSLVAGYVAEGNSPLVQEITSRSLNEGIGAVADAIAGIQSDAGHERGAGQGSAAAAPDPAATPGPVEAADPAASPRVAARQVLPGALWCAAGMALGLVLMGLAVLLVMVARRRS